jgi:hypothetical protein
MGQKWAKNGPKMGQKWVKNGHPVENFFVSKESRDFFSYHILLPIVDLKNIWRGRHSGPMGGKSQKWANYGPKMGQKWAKNGHPVENFFVSEESRDFFQLSHTTTYSGPLKKMGGGPHWYTGRK